MILLHWWNKTFRKPIDKVKWTKHCPNCYSENIGKTTLTNNSYACKKCKTWWVSPNN